MSWKLVSPRGHLPKIAASGIVAGVAVKTDSTKDQAVLAASNNDYPLGVSVATAASAGNPLAVARVGDVVPAICAASVAAGAEVGVASTNGALGPVVAASGFRRFTVGEAQENSTAGNTFSVLIRPRELTGTAY